MRYPIVEVEMAQVAQGKAATVKLRVRAEFDVVISAENITEAALMAHVKDADEGEQLLALAIEAAVEGETEECAGWVTENERAFVVGVEDAQVTLVSPC